MNTLPQTLQCAFDDFSFEPEAHIYRWKDTGAPIPGVTSVLKATGPDPYAFAPILNMERGRAWGTALHEALHLHLMGTLDPASIAGTEIEGELRGITKFLGELGYEPLYHEQPLALRAPLPFAGTLDGLGRIRDGRIALIDLKRTSGKQAHWGLQMAAYAILAAHRLGLEPELWINIRAHKGKIKPPVTYPEHATLRAQWMARLVKFYEQEEQNVTLDDRQ